MRPRSAALAALAALAVTGALSLCLASSTERAATPAREASYAAVVAEVAAARRRARARPDAAAVAVAAVRRVADQWLGTRWGLGAPQATIPGPGHINCGTFVGRVLRDAGFDVDVARLQRQPSQLIAESLVGRAGLRRWSDAPMARFLADVAAMGPGVFIIGLDFHVGLLIQSERELRFVHASYLTGTVVDEPAAHAVPITTSRYRVVGKLFGPRSLRGWLDGRRVRVIGDW